MNFFVTGTGTDVGKTFVATALLIGAQRRGQPLRYWKPVQTGGRNLDQNAVQALHDSLIPAHFKTWSYPLPASPDQAAADAGLPAPTLNQLKQELARDNAPILVEGAGGLLVPLNEQNETWRDFAVQTHLPVVLVASTSLGTINHTLLSLEALDMAGVRVQAVILNGAEHTANMQSLRRMRPDQRFHAFPWFDINELDASWFKACEALYDFVNETPKASAENWTKIDHDHVWHPYTQHQTAPAPIPLVRAKGIYLETASGEQLIDASASWWTNSTGHGHPKIGAAIVRQQQKLDHCIFGGATHEPASLLARELVQLTQGLLPRVFYSDNGSCAVEIALKMAAQSWQNRGVTHRQKFLFFKGAYHGDTFGAMSVGASEGFHKAFSPYLFQGHSLRPITSHASRLCPDGPAALQQGMGELHALFAEHGDELAGVIIEPWVQGASGMHLQDLRWLRRLGELTRQHQIPLILDEVFTGMGRVGSYFAFQRVGLEPDIVCIAKGLTGGTLPLAATLTTDAIFQTFLHAEGSRALLHGHTFTGNAMACAAALATLDIYRSEKLIERVRSTEDIAQNWLESRAIPMGLIAPRAVGAILAFELPGTGTGDYFHPLALKVPEVARRHGLLMRTLGNTMYFVPPLAIQNAEFMDALARIERTLGELQSTNPATPR